MASYVIVHGAWGGGWEWTPVAKVLRMRGHQVFTPTLTGMGERAHLGWGQAIDLATHVQDVVAVLEFEDLHGVVLCGASYGGMAVTGAADRAADRVGLVVYIDALVPTHGQSGLDLLPEPFVHAIHAGMAEHGASWRVPMPPDLWDQLVPPGSIPDDRGSAYAARVTDHPVTAFTDPIRLTGAIDRLSRAFVRCTGGVYAGDLSDDPIEPIAARARTESWAYRELPAPHDPQVFDPDGIAAILDELARAVGGHDG